MNPAGAFHPVHVIVNTLLPAGGEPCSLWLTPWPVVPAPSSQTLNLLMSDKLIEPQVFDMLFKIDPASRTRLLLDREIVRASLPLPEPGTAALPIWFPIPLNPAYCNASTSTNGPLL